MYNSLKEILVIFNYFSVFGGFLNFLIMVALLVCFSIFSIKNKHDNEMDDFKNMISSFKTAFIMNATSAIFIFMKFIIIAPLVSNFIDKLLSIPSFVIFLMSIFSILLAYKSMSRYLK